MKQLRTSVLHAKALSNAIKLLNAIGAQYAIKDAEGNLHGDVKAVSKQKKASDSKQYIESSFVSSNNATITNLKVRQRSLSKSGKTKRNNED